MTDAFAGGRPALWAGGQATAESLGHEMGPVKTPASKTSARMGAAAALAAAMLGDGVKGPVLFPCGDLRRDELPARLEDDGVAVEEVVCYRSVLASEGRLGRRRSGPTSGGGEPEGGRARWRGRVRRGVRPALLAVGPTTAGAARGSGWPPAAVSRRPAAAALVVGGCARSLTSL